MKSHAVGSIGGSDDATRVLIFTAKCGMSSYLQAFPACGFDIRALTKNREMKKAKEEIF